jgi:UDP-N-acetylglucosamine 2-epimerase (non-hydrolysing)
LRSILDALLEVDEQLEVIFPVHPPTRQRIEQFGINIERLHLVEPLPYIEFLALQRRAVVVITDSGGIQEETTYLGVPCLTLRNSTERPVKVSMGTNLLLGQDQGCSGLSWQGFSMVRPRRDRYHHSGTVMRGSGSRKLCVHRETS